MRRSRLVLMVSSLAVVLFLLASGAALKSAPGEGTFKQMLLFSEILSYVTDSYVDPVEPDKLMGGAYEGLMGGLDSQGSYLSAEEVAAWKRGIAEPSSADAGIAVLKNGAVLQVVAVREASSAASSGIEAGDQIRKIDGRSVRTLSLDQSVRALQGAPGSTVALDIVRVKDLLRRDEVQLSRSAPHGAAFRLEVVGGVAVLKVTDFHRIVLPALADELRSVRDRGVDRVLVDLRDVAYASARLAGPVADLFASGEFLRLEDRSGRAVDTLKGERSDPAWSGPVAVLVNGATAGAGEALALILKESRHAVVYGESTYGLGAEAKLIELPEGGGLLVPAYVWETASGRRWNEDGLTPDKVLRSGARTAAADDRQLQDAIEDFAKAA